jgi:hypothetical protein
LATGAAREAETAVGAKAGKAETVLAKARKAGKAVLGGEEVATMVAVAAMRGVPVAKVAGAETVVAGSSTS